MALEHVRCPSCGARELRQTHCEVLRGNPVSPASDTEIETRYRCASCGQTYWSNQQIYDAAHVSALYRVAAHESSETLEVRRPDAATSHAPPVPNTPAPARRRPREAMRFDYGEAPSTVRRFRRELAGRLRAVMEGREPVAPVVRDLNYVYDHAAANDALSRSVPFVVRPTGSERRFIRWLAENHPSEVSGAIGEFAED